MEEPGYNRREFLALASLALSVPAVSSAFAETSGELECLIYDAQGEALPPSALERFHLCDSLMRPFTVPFETDSGRVRFTTPSDRPFRISVPLTVPGFGQVFVYADESGPGYTARSLSQATPLVSTARRFQALSVWAFDAGRVSYVSLTAAMRSASSSPADTPTGGQDRIATRNSALIR